MQVQKILAQIPRPDVVTEISVDVYPSTDAHVTNGHNSRKVYVVGD